MCRCQFDIHANQTAQLEVGVPFVFVVTVRERQPAININWRVTNKCRLLGDSAALQSRPKVLAVLNKQTAVTNNPSHWRLYVPPHRNSRHLSSDSDTPTFDRDCTEPLQIYSTDIVSIHNRSWLVGTSWIMTGTERGEETKILRLCWTFWFKR